ncbi:MAG: 2-C-methyl-D-erythritol 2,4-cyclodiphosphate synthase [Actinomycetota bacterium]|nr:2-C-methyl-D-erythritol 2,4-cyclodiphosphate synthase [Actinomycetota bacterium]
MTRVGLGFDAHAFDPDRRLVLGGVKITDSPGLAGHSDADVVAHALADALLGAAALGDLGSRFPDTNEWKNADSLVILKECAAAVSVAGYGIVNVDVTVVAQRPRLAAHIDAMAATLASTLDLAPADVSVKATTTDGMGFTGRGEGIAALAIVAIDAS